MGRGKRVRVVCVDVCVCVCVGGGVMRSVQPRYLKKRLNFVLHLLVPPNMYY